MSKKKIGLIACVLAVIALIAGGIWKYNRTTYITIDEVEYRRDITQLDLSGQTVTELEKLQELTALTELNLRDTGISTEQYDQLQQALPDCEILWSVPFQEGYLSNDIETLPLDSLSTGDFAALNYLPDLKSVNADTCRDYAALMELMEQYPELDVSYTVDFGSTTYPQTQQTLELTDPDVDALIEQLQYLPEMQTVTLTGTLPENEKMLKLQQTYPDITFLFDLEVFGIATNTQAETLDLSNIAIESAADVEAILPHFYNLTHVEMVNCGIPNKDMDALNRSHKDTKFVWTVKVSGVTVRTDITYFMPWQYNMELVGDCYNLRYCTDLIALDFGHKALFDLTFLEYLPKLEFLGLCQDPITDISVIANCTSLKCLELFLTNVDDFWPLTNLTNLEDLNISYTPAAKYGVYGTFGDITPLLQMTWLDRLWMANSRLSTEKQNALKEALPNTTLLFHSDGSTNRGWRQSPNYYRQRDIMGMWYMIH